MSKFVLGREVAAAIHIQPVVALESTIIAHGMPWPANYETALSVENEVRSQGAVPATIAIIDGVVKIGLDEKELEQLARMSDVQKVSRRDLPGVIAGKKNGATTVAATMILAQKAGISIFATGGIGGVHRGAEKTMDISADLTELARTDVVVVCAGVKSILDIGLTLEYLETLGVPVIGYRTQEFPAFFCSESGFAAPISVKSPQDIAEMLAVKRALGLEGGMLVANPVPHRHDMKRDSIEDIIGRALIQCEEGGITGKEVTPFLLNKVNELSAGRSLLVNQALIRSNAALAAQIACAL